MALNFTMSGVQAKLRLNHERAYILASDGRPYKATPVIHFAGGEGELWTTIYMITRLIRGFEGMLFRVTINNEKFNVRKEVTLRETGSLVSSMAASIAGIVTLRAVLDKYIVCRIELTKHSPLKCVSEKHLMF